MLKTCSRCKQSKQAEDFNRSAKGSLGLHGHCRDCQKTCRAEWYRANLERERAKASDFSKSKRGIESRRKRYREDQAFREAHLSKNRERRRSHAARKKANMARAIWMENEAKRISCAIRARTRKALLGISKAASTMTMLGCSSEELKAHLESQFLDGMSWDNYGYYGWHIDHIRPCASFDLTKQEHQMECFHYKNLRPAWRFDNQSKGAKYKKALEALT